MLQLLENFGGTMQKKLHYLIGQLLEILLRNLISQHAIFDKTTWVLIATLLRVVEDRDMTFSKLFYAKGKG